MRQFPRRRLGLQGGRVGENTEKRLLDFCLWQFRTSQLLISRQCKATVDACGYAYCSSYSALTGICCAIHIGVGLCVARSVGIGQCEGLELRDCNKYRFPRFFFYDQRLWGVQDTSLVILYHKSDRPVAGEAFPFFSASPATERRIITVIL